MICSHLRRVRLIVEVERAAEDNRHCARAPVRTEAHALRALVTGR